MTEHEVLTYIIVPSPEGHKNNIRHCSYLPDTINLVVGFFTFVEGKAMYTEEHIKLREEISRDVQNFLDSGGKITQVPPNVSASSKKALKESVEAFMDEEDCDPVYTAQVV